MLGQPIAKDQAGNIRRLRMKIGPVFQDFKLIKGRTAIENVMFGMRFLGLPSSQIKEEVNNALVNVGLEHKVLSLVEHLSWGECQRVSRARAGVRKPAVILADQPTGQLDTDNALKILELLTSLKDKKTTVIITTHATHLIEDKNYDKLIHVDGGIIHCERVGLA